MRQNATWLIVRGYFNTCFQEEEEEEAAAAAVVVAVEQEVIGTEIVIEIDSQAVIHHQKMIVMDRTDILAQIEFQ